MSPVNTTVEPWADKIGDPDAWQYEDAVPWHEWSLRYRIPVLSSWYPQWNYHVALVVPDQPDGQRSPWRGMMPDEAEVAILGSYLRFGIERYYNAQWIKKMAQAPLDTDGTVNPHMFLKREEGWRYMVSSWTMHGPWPFREDEPAFPGLTGLVGLLDWLERDESQLGCPKSGWVAWKAAHPDVFTVEGSWVLPAGVEAWPPPRNHEDDE